MLKIAICDDEELQCSHTAKLISALPGYKKAQIQQFTNPWALIYSIKEDNYIPDIAVLDIQMQEMDGITLAKEINSHAGECQIIFLSGYLSYALDVYDAEHVFFILKSEIEQRIEAALDRALEKRGSAYSHHIIVTSGGVAERIPWGKVFYLERQLRRTKIACDSGELWTSTVPKGLLASLDESRYCHCHKSFYVNLSRVSALLNNEFIMDNGAHVPISRYFHKEAKEAFLFGSVHK